MSRSRPGIWERTVRFLNQRFFGSLSGLMLGDWLRLLRKNRFRIDLPYWPRAAFLTGLSLGNSVIAPFERRIWQRRLATSPQAPAPLFILGHWRSGTTHLHNLLAQDCRLASPTFFEVLHPHTFLLTETVLTRALAPLVPRERPVDAVQLGWNTPAEDEFALAVRTGMSPYLGWSFPANQSEYERFLTFRDATPGECKLWKDALVDLVQKWSFHHGRRIVLKSPAHTGRVRLLLEAFPDAHFLHIHRHPFDVYRSTEKLLRHGIEALRLQRPDPGRLKEEILDRYTRLHDAWFEDQPLIPPGQFHELTFSELEGDPISAIQRAYAALGMDFASAQAAVAAYLETLTRFEKNHHAPMDLALRNEISRRWERTLTAWGYSVD